MKASYAAKHWIATLLLAPMLMIVYQVIIEQIHYVIGIVSMYFLFVIFSMVFSFPVFVLYYLGFERMQAARFSPPRIKIISLSGLVPVTISVLYWIGGSLIEPMMVCYASAIIATGLLLPVSVEQRSH